MNENSVTIVNGWPCDPTGRHELRYWDGTNWTGPGAPTGPSNPPIPPMTSAPTPKRKHIPIPKFDKPKTGSDVTQFLWGTITVLLGALMLAAIAVDSDNGGDIIILFYVTLGVWTILKKINELKNDD